MNRLRYNKQETKESRERSIRELFRSAVKIGGTALAINMALVACGEGDTKTEAVSVANTVLIPEVSTTQVPTTTEAPKITTTTERKAEKPETPEHKKPEIGQRLATISIPSIGLEAGLYGGTDTSVIDHEDYLNPATGQPEPVVGFDTRGAMLGDMKEYGGKSVLFAHRTTHTKPLNKANKLQVGDTMTIGFTDGIDPAATTDSQAWRMVRTEVIDQNDPRMFSEVFAEGDSGKPELVMFACSNPDGGTGDAQHPYTASHRIVTFWEQAELPQ